MAETRRERSKRLRVLAKATPMERRIYVLPSRMVDEILTYQETRRLPTEISAARELLDQALTAKGFTDGTQNMPVLRQF